MRIKLTQQGRATREEIHALEGHIGIQLPGDYVAFMMKNNGAQPEANVFAVGDVNKSSVRSFLAVKDVPAIILQIENLPPQTFPIALDDCGNYVLLHQAGVVSFWEHEQPEALIEITKSFTAFLEVLEPFDTSSVELRPEQVKKAWIDPNFLKSLEGQ